MKSAARRTSKSPARRRICFVSGTRAEFGLMRSVLEAIRAQPKLDLQLIATGMHLDRSRGRSIDQIRDEGFRIDTVVPWAESDLSARATAVATGNAIAHLADQFERLRSDIILVVGDRVEPFAAASAAHISGRIVAHVHGGDRALGIIDDSLRHAITKLAHIHFPATRASALRIARLGEDPWRIIRAGSPGLDGITRLASSASEIARELPELGNESFALLVVHPQSSEEREQHQLAQKLANACITRFDRVVIVYPNNDPGSSGITRVWDSIQNHPKLIFRRNLSRPLFLGLLRDAAVLVGNSSSGIIEAASFGTPVIDVGSRQAGRERGKNVFHVPGPGPEFGRVLAIIQNRGRPLRFGTHNFYAGRNAGKTIAQALARISFDRFRTKLIAY